MTDRVILITGAAGGIGSATARRLAGEGARLVLLDQTEEAVEALAATLETEVLTASGDIVEPATTRDAVDQAVRRFGRIDGAFLNAGMEGRVTAIEDQALDDFDRIMQVNVRSVFIGLACVMPLMKAQEAGSVVITSSAAGLRASSGLAPYVTSKHAVIGMMRTAALEGAGHNVRVNTIHPGAIDTRMIRELEMKFSPDDLERGRKTITAGIPAGRYGTPEEVAALVSFLLSDEAGFCNGGTYQIDGASLAGPRARKF
ncbi:SDR family NAD(P)-dependent oxidoreductase [Seohaeicola zhoushanensis]|uniref:Short-chain dehydrogenase n=1 Tax=Seohaeicola zhoushanensis TaxID=1569283 RepID=A0A8J3H2D0_9RHOB|nr:SDR family oxidoreductase [Seohaeicola zhoushanensis]GHF67394.1 short-chain dehydrogenase [Seohaeicola zhoushanensis]